ncbi:MAG: ATP-dependent Clp protease proteolytic subunit [Alphaproteobacteria bacterium]|nr:ATP-dependent Clp protease proteolytic subunit [Alphaproteobacteria bacterium]
MANFDIKPSKWLNESKQGNFVFAPVGNVCNVQIFDKISMEKCAEMLGNLAQIIAQLPAKPIYTASAKIVSPYDISPDIFVFDVMINSSGGDVNVYKSISSLFALAKSRGAIVRTQNIGSAASCASMLAIQGTPGYRVMYDTACNYIHFGKTTLTVERADEFDIATQNSKINREQVRKVYQAYTKLTPDEIKKFITVEGAGNLFARKSLEKGVCDWILTIDGKLIGRKGR